MWCTYVHVSRHLKEELAWAIDKQLQLYNDIKNGYTTKKTKNKDILNLKQYCMHCYVVNLIDFI